ncbi:hypothetical protein SAMN02745912_01426 [Paramaledivibacter caminithermalis DSM 15212]|jgi:hypothetical protein|uniref:Uncharacterized protein n=1 Tax=Paramaledivibacter caminithermalis (strain DSM 15212 / CIP 107654 / DViRD3) TaxID=1121301 RepID=A0A1M6MTX8_PARC5|nr:hypothetical protein SAMN02745912_01426 [Paramaledivibacter caminithermalis DSM 15212]
MLMRMSLKLGTYNASIDALLSYITKLLQITKLVVNIANK